MSEGLEFFLSVMIIYDDERESETQLKTLRNLWKYVNETVDAIDARNHAKDILTDDSPQTYPSSPPCPRGLSKRLGNRIVSSSYPSGRFSPIVPIEKPPLSMSLRLTPAPMIPTASSSSISRAPSIKIQPATKNPLHKTRLRHATTMFGKPPKAVDKINDASNESINKLSIKDLRRLDFQFAQSDRQPSILDRRHCLVFSFYPVRAILLADRVILLCPSQSTPENSVISKSTSFVKPFESFMKEWNPNVNEKISPELTESRYKLNIHTKFKHHQLPSTISIMPFEQHALQGLLAIVKLYEECEYKYINRVLRGTFEHYKNNRTPSVETEVIFKNMKNALSALKKRILSYEASLVNLTENDDHMALMNLTFLSERPHLYTVPLISEILQRHEVIEDLLECDLLDFTNIEHNITQLENRVSNVEAMYKIQLNIIENKALRSDTTIMLLVCSIAFSAYIAGAFGMNLDNVTAQTGIREWFGGFSLIFVVTFVCIALTFYMIMLSLIWAKMFPSLNFNE